MTEAKSRAPWFAGEASLLHEISSGEPPYGLALTTITKNETETRRLDGNASSPDARWPVSDASGSMYFTLDPVREPKLIRRSTSPGGTENLVSTLPRSIQPFSPIVVSPNETFLATAGIRGAPAGDGGGPRSEIIIQHISDGEPPSEAYMGLGEDPRFISDSTIVFSREGGIWSHDILSGELNELVPGGEARLRDPIVGSSGEHVWFQAVGGDSSDRSVSLCKVSVDDGIVWTVARSDRYEIRSFDVAPSGVQIAVLAVEG